MRPWWSGGKERHAPTCADGRRPVTVLHASTRKRRGRWRAWAACLASSGVPWLLGPMPSSVLGRKPYAQDLRDRLITALAAGTATQRVMAERFGVSGSFVAKLWPRWRRSGSSAPKPHAGGRPHSPPGTAADRGGPATRCRAGCIACPRSSRTRRSPGPARP
jgi:hypothetical protein